MDQPRALEITDLERIARFRTAGYGGAVSDSLRAVGVTSTVFADVFLPLRPDMKLIGRALTVRLHSLPGAENLPPYGDPYWVDKGEHPQKRMMRAVDSQPDGTILVFDCGGDRQAAHFGEMSAQLAYAHGCRGMLLAGNCRDTQYVLKMPDFPVYSYGTRPNAFGGWMISAVNEPIFLPGHLTHYVEVTPGDFIYGDSDGVQLIPEMLVDEVLLRVEDIFQAENRQRQLIADGMSVDVVYEEFGVL